MLVIDDVREERFEGRADGEHHLVARIVEPFRQVRVEGAHLLIAERGADVRYDACQDGAEEQPGVRAVVVQR